MNDTSPNRVQEIVSLKHRVSAVLQEALSGMDAWGDPTRFRDDRGYVRWGLVEKEIYKFIDEANSLLDGNDPANAPADRPAKAGERSGI